MNKENGRRSARWKSFSIHTLQPSKIVQETKFSWEEKVLDLWCGNFRNALFLATKGCIVKAIDIADLHHYLDEIDDTIKANITYSISDLNNYHFSEKHNIILACRLFQYLTLSKVESLICDSYNHLFSWGKLLVSINIWWGIFNRTEIDVPKYKHNINTIIDHMKETWFIVNITKWASINMHVNYTENIDAYDIEAIKY